VRVGTIEHFRWLNGIVVATLVLNLADALLTIGWVAAGAADEANPLLSGLVHGHPALFAAVKIALVSLGSWVLWRFRRRGLAVVAIFVGFLAYYFLLLYHLQALELGLLKRLFG
jgi:hypothetical protein